MPRGVLAKNVMKVGMTSMRAMKAAPKKIAVKPILKRASSKGKLLISRPLPSEVRLSTVPPVQKRPAACFVQPASGLSSEEKAEFHAKQRTVLLGHRLPGASATTATHRQMDQPSLCEKSKLSEKSEKLKLKLTILKSLREFQAWCLTHEIALDSVPNVCLGALKYLDTLFLRGTDGATVYHLIAGLKEFCHVVSGLEKESQTVLLIRIEDAVISANVDHYLLGVTPHPAVPQIP